MKSEFIETIKADDGKIFHIEYHQKRYESVLDSFGVDYTVDLREFVKPPKSGLYRCRLKYSISNPKSIEVLYFKYKKREISSLKIVHSNDIDYRYKYSDREDLDKLYGLRDGCDDVLIVKNNLITDTSIANTAFYRDGVWYTPKTPLLKGTTRQRYLNEGKIIESDIDIRDLNMYSKISLMNAMVDFDIITDMTFEGK